jgi:excisionase family DNA binding protein
MSRIIVLSPEEIQELIEQTVRVTIEAVIQEFKLNGQKEIQKEILNVTETADFLYLAKQTIYGLTSKGEIPYFKRGNKLYFKRSLFVEWINAGRRKTNSEIQFEAEAYVKQNRLRR